MVNNMDWYYILLIVLTSIVVFICLLVWVFIHPGNPKKCIDHKWMYENKIAHRGLFNNEKGIVENTKTAFLLAIEKGYNIETDISLTKDEQIIVYHDNDFKRLFNVDKKIGELTLEEIKKLKYEKSNDPVMEFKEFLDLLDGKTGLVLEFKSHSSKKDKILCQKAMDILKNYKGKYVVQSFQPLIVGWFKKNYPIIPRGQLCMRFDLKKERKQMKGKPFKQRFTSALTKWLYNHKFTNIISRPVFLDHSFQNIDFVAKLIHLKIPMIVYTVTTQKDYDYIVNKVDNIIFENLELNNNGN